jgi:hypothetical protein
MTNQSNPTRVRIHSHITQSRFLHVEDALGIGTGKIRLFAGTYSRGQGMKAYVAHFLDLADALVVFRALARGERRFAYKEYKGTPPQNGSAAVSRVLSIVVKGENVYVELKTGPGKLTNTGAITPNGKPEVEVNVSFKLYEARRMAACVLAYIHAWDVMRMMCHHQVVACQQIVSQPAPYLLVSTTSADNGIKVTPADGAPKPNSATRPPVVAANNGRPATRKGPDPKTNGTAAKQANGHRVNPSAAASDDQPLKYGNGLAIDSTNLTEVQTFQRYVAEKNTVPESKAVLLDYYRQRAQAPASVVSQ